MLPKLRQTKSFWWQACCTLPSPPVMALTISACFWALTGEPNMVWVPMAALLAPASRVGDLPPTRQSTRKRRTTSIHAPFKPKMPCNPHKHCLQAFLVFCVSVHTANTPHHAPSSVIPAQAGIHVLRVGGMDSRRRGNDDRAWLSKCRKCSNCVGELVAHAAINPQTQHRVGYGLQPNPRYVL